MVPATLGSLQQFCCCRTSDIGSDMRPIMLRVRHHCWYRACAHGRHDGILPTYQVRSSS